MESEFWTKLMRQRLSRRMVVQGGIAAGVGLWAGSTLGCDNGGGSKQSAGPKAETKIEQRKMVLDQQKRVKAIQDIQRLIQDDAPWCPSFARRV